MRGRRAAALDHRVRVWLCQRSSGKVSGMTPTHPSSPSEHASATCPHCADLAHELALQPTRVAAAQRRIAHLTQTHEMRESALSAAVLTAPDAADLARAQADADMLGRIRATWWFRVFGRRMARRNDP